jgi:hypothetical protein
MSHRARSRRLTLAAQLLLKEPNLNTPNEMKKSVATVESSTLQTWHKSAPWLISGVSILGLIIIFQR